MSNRIHDESHLRSVITDYDGTVEKIRAHNLTIINGRLKRKAQAPGQPQIDAADRERRILELRDQGCTYDVIHQRLGCSLHVISNALHRAGRIVKIVSRERRPKASSPETTMNPEQPKPVQSVKPETSMHDDYMRQIAHLTACGTSLDDAIDIVLGEKN
jgi:DNA-binding CsgD family transcriptional regulator